MARNYKRDTRGRFARVAGSRARGSKSARGGVRMLSPTGVRAAPIQKPAKGRVIVAVDRKGNARKVSVAQARKIQGDNRRIARAAQIGALAGGFIGMHGGPLGIPVGVVTGSYIGAGIASRANKRRR